MLLRRWTGAGFPPAIASRFVPPLHRVRFALPSRAVGLSTAPTANWPRSSTQSAARIPKPPEAPAGHASCRRQYLHAGARRLSQLSHWSSDTVAAVASLAYPLLSGLVSALSPASCSPPH